MITEFDLLTHHEAGHAAVAYGLGVPLGCVRVIDVGSGGQTALAVHTTIMQDALILLAGGRAEKILCPALHLCSEFAVDDEIAFGNLIDNYLSTKHPEWSLSLDGQLYLDARVERFRKPARRML